MKLIALLAVLASLSLTACNTTEGLGKDVERGGEGIQNTANRNR